MSTVVPALMIGLPQDMTQNVVYGLPAIKCNLYVTGAPTLLQSNTFSMAATTPVTLVEGAYQVTGGYIKCTSGNITVLLKKT